MKIVAKPISMVAWFDSKGVPHPVRFRIEEESQEEVVIKIGRVITKEKEKLAGNHMLIFNCQSIIKGVEKPYQLKYELSTCKWILFKI
ncbi:hypothetical protein [Clostridium sp.]|uniref:hypothetical protein n=1 Tax=Clostridium sp. TaxID=1506 RepID=UPI002FC64AA5